jgi:hypothetical protein
MNHSRVLALLNPESGIKSRDAGTIRSFGASGATGAIGDSGDHVAATLHLLNQYASQFGVVATDYSLTSNNGLGMPGKEFSIDHAGNLELRHWKFG